MTTSAKRVLKDAMRLTAEERAEIATRLIGSLDAASVDDAGDVQAAWAAEIERRCADLDAGRTRTIAWKTVRRRIETAIRRK